jgi:hypothetical protein
MYYTLAVRVLLPPTNRSLLSQKGFWDSFKGAEELILFGLHHNEAKVDTKLQKSRAILARLYKEASFLVPVKTFKLLCHFRIYVWHTIRARAFLAALALK